MITVQKAKEIISKAHPKETISQCFEYKGDFFVFELKEGDKKTFDSPFYAVSKLTGKISSVNPTDDLDNFFDDMESNQIKV